MKLFSFTTSGGSGPGGGVTDVTGTAPIVSSGGTTPAISIPVATGSTSGYLSSTDWTTFNSKGDVTGPASSVNNTVSVFSGTGGKTIKQGTGMTVDPSTGIAVMLPSSGGFTNTIEMKPSAIASNNCLTIRNATTPASNFFEIGANSGTHVRSYLCGAMETFWLQTINSTNGPKVSLSTVSSTHTYDIWVPGTAFGSAAGSLYFQYNGTATARITTTGQFELQVVGKGISIKEGSNAKMGQSTMTGGTVTVSTTAVTANSRIFLTCAVVGGVQGILSVGTITAATSFVINSSNVADTSTVNWIIYEPS